MLKNHLRENSNYHGTNINYLRDNFHNLRTRHRIITDIQEKTILIGQHIREPGDLLLKIFTTNTNPRIGKPLLECFEGFPVHLRTPCIKSTTVIIIWKQVAIIISVTHNFNEINKGRSFH